MIDLKIKDEEGSFKFRTCIILKFKDKILFTRMNNVPFYCLPGGHVELGESTVEATIRECKEELGIDIKIDKLVAIHENFFTRDDGKIFHELGYYYLCTALDEKQVRQENYSFIEMDKGRPVKHEIMWVDKYSIKDLEFKPLALKHLFFNEDLPFQHIITK